MSIHHKRLIEILALSVLLLMTFNFGAVAQEATPEATPLEIIQPTVEPTPVPTEMPTSDVPTVEPTPEVTELPTLEPTDAQPTAEMPTVEPPVELTAEATAAPEVTAEATVEAVSEPPVFGLPNGTTFVAVPGVPLAVELSVSDETGVVRVMVGEPAPIGGINLTLTPPVETQPPFITQVELVYLAPAEFSGADTITLIAVDAAGVTAEATLTINVTPAIPSPTPEPTPAPVKELLINYNPAASEETIQAMLASLNAVEISRIPAIGAMRVLVPDAVSEPSSAVARLQSTGSVYSAAGVMAVEPNHVYRLDAYVPPNDPFFKQNQQWALSGEHGIYAPYAWAQSTTIGYGVTIAVLDTGVDRQHPDLSLQLLTTGWDFFNDDNDPDDSINGLDFSEDPPAILDNLGHGTLVAGIIAAKTNNLIGMAGVAYNAKIMPVKVCDRMTDPVSSDYYVGCPAYYVAAGIVHAVDKGARIINLSLGDEVPSTTLLGAINYALSRNVVVVASVGNTYDDTLHYPAAYPGVIGVGAYGNNGVVADFSVHNVSVDIVAPGVNVLSSIPSEWDLDDGLADGYTNFRSGTSFAAPHVTGVAALLLSAKVATTPATVMDALACGAQNDFAGYDSAYYGSGLLKADFSMNWNGNSASCKITQPNDNFESAKLVSRVPFSFVQPVHSRSVTEQASDPLVCGLTAEQTLWYSYRAPTSGYYQFSVLGSSYPVVFGVYQGSAGALTQVGCSTDLQKAVPLQAAQTYYIMVATNGAAVDDQVMQLQINMALPLNNTDYQENTPYFAYSGMWTRGAVLGSSGGYTQQTSDLNAAASFSFRGTSFYYVRTVGPDKGTAKVLVNGVLVTTISNRAALTKGNQAVEIIIPNAIPGQWNIVRIMRDVTIPGMIDLDRIRTFDYDGSKLKAAIVGKADDRDARLTYSPAGEWNKTITLGTAYLKTLSETSTDNASVVFRATGNAITIFRMTGTGYADMQVIIDSGTPMVVSNTAPGGDAIRPYTIDGLVPMPHVVEIKRVAGVGRLQLDAVQSATLLSLSPNIKYDDRHTYLAYRGVWEDKTGAVLAAGANALTTRTLKQGSEVSFQFNSTGICLNYQRPNGAIDILIDGVLMKDDGQPNTIAADSGNGFKLWCLDADLYRLVPYGTHRAVLKVVDTVDNSFTLDYVLPKNISILTPARGLVQETDLSFTYNPPAAWTQVANPAQDVISVYRPQGGYMKHTEVTLPTENFPMVSFYINGTGFILYTAVGSAQGCWQVKVDDSVHANIDLFDQRSRPLGYGVTGLEPGIHYVLLTVNKDCASLGASTWMANLDAIRVFP